MTISRDNDFNKVITGIIARDKADIISFKTQYGMYMAAMNGRVISYPSYGYKISEDKRLEVNESEAQIVRFIYDLLSERRFSLRKIAETLRILEVPTPNECKRNIKNPRFNWSMSTVSKILRNKVYIGILVYGEYSVNKKVVEIHDNHEPIITIKQFDKVQEIMDMFQCIHKTKY